MLGDLVVIYTPSAYMTYEAPSVFCENEVGLIPFIRLSLKQHWACCRSGLAGLDVVEHVFVVPEGSRR